MSNKNSSSNSGYYNTSSDKDYRRNSFNKKSGSGKIVYSRNNTQGLCKDLTKDFGGKTQSSVNYNQSIKNGQLKSPSMDE